VNQRIRELLDQDDSFARQREIEILRAAREQAADDSAIRRKATALVKALEHTQAVSAAVRQNRDIADDPEFVLPSRQEEEARAIGEDIGPFQTVATARELLRLEQWRATPFRVRLYRSRIDQREWPAGVDVAALREKCAEILRAK